MAAQETSHNSCPHHSTVAMLQLSPPAVVVREDGGTVQICVLLQGDTFIPVSVQLLHIPGTAALNSGNADCMHGCSYMVVDLQWFK